MKLLKLRTQVLIILISMQLVGCPLPIIPGDRSSSRQNIGDAVPEFIVSGKTTRADVLLALGEPDGISDHSEWAVYLRKTSRGGLGFFLVVPNGIGGAGAEGMTYRRLTIRFDDSGIVTDARHETVSCSERALQIDNSVADLWSLPCSISGENTLLTDSSGILQSDDKIQDRIFAPALWHPRLHGFDQIKALQLESPAITGSLIVGAALIVFVSPNADSKSEPLLKLEYSEIGDVYVDTWGFGRRVVMKRTNGTYESFSMHGDAQLTESAAALIKSRWRAATTK